METVQCPHCSAPLSSPEEVCKKCLSEEENKRFKHLWLVGVSGALLLSLLSALVGIVARNYIYASYQPASCTIQSKDVSPTFYKDGSIKYNLPLTYSVLAPDEHQEIVTGYKGPYFDGWKDGYSNFDDAENALVPYEIGEHYPCWYTSLKLPHAVLVLANYPLDAMSLSFLGEMAVSIILLLLILILWIWWQQLTLMRRGISAQGRLVFSDLYVNGKKMSVGRVVEFATQTEFPQRYQVMRSRWLVFPKEDTAVNVLYDPQNPAANAYVGKRRDLAFFFIFVSVYDLVLLAGWFYFFYMLWIR